MSDEQARSVPQPAAPGDLPTADQAIEALSDRAGAFYSALMNEHFVLESARSITVSEASSRAALYLTTLSSALVAFGFLAQTDYALVFLMVVIPVIFLLGIFSYERLVEISLEDVTALESIQRIRAVYTTTLPGAAKYFPRPTGPHAPNEMLPIGRRRSWVGVFFTTATMTAVVNSMVAGAGVAIVVVQATSQATESILIGLGTAALLAVLHGLYQEFRYASLRLFLHRSR
jgi:hypothetical protein